MSKRARPRSGASKEDERERLLLDQLKQIAGGIGAEVREEKLVREVGYAVHSGPCRVRGRDVVLLDTNAELAERIDTMIAFLSTCDLESLYIEPHLREMITGHSSGETGGAEG